MKIGNGLAGNSGLGAEYHNAEVFHVSAPFSNNGMVFVDVDDGKCDWKRVPEAEADPAKIIRCSEPGCEKPAVMLDHFYPYHSENNRCEGHGGA